ncbi:MAG: PQQ-dependent sugar dehydrogenase [Actinomycetota bacterium]
MTRRLAIALTTLGLLAAACASDDPTETAEGVTTVPTVTVPSTTTPTTTQAPDEPEPDDTGSDETTTTSTTTTTTTVPAGDVSVAAVELETLARLVQPIDAVVAPNGEWWIAQRTGEVLVIDPDSGVTGDVVLDINDETTARGERGLLGLAVDDEALYANFTDLDGTTNVDAWLLDEAGRPGERVPLITIDQPFGNHNGGALAIGPDGHLYIGVGDGGSADDPLNAGQDPDQILGSIVRIDPTPGEAEPYAIPPDNPYADGGGVPEIFTIGLRNPWRIAFDPATDDLWVADVGQNRWEEITLLLGANGWGLGDNLGWRLREGAATFGGERPDGNVDPVFVYPHGGGTPSGCSITGGEVYRGTAIPELHGAYVFGDYCTSRLWAISVATGEVVFRDLDASLPGGELVDFASDPDGELVAMSLSGQVVRILPA